ncbi:GNAT family N-acetyltransferase [Arcanobacterium haemolyticum]|nr:GNAT family N-acetyltransferase [Arcanobacterium haemolyticum]
MDSHLFVRPATGLDARAIGDIHARTMAASLTAAVGERLSDDVTSMIDADAFSSVWSAAIASPPSEFHHILVAIADGVVVGFAALAPAELPASDDSTKPGVPVELTALEVPAAFQRAGHGSRLLAAATDTAREQGATDVSMWVLAGDDARTKFLTAAGFAPAGLRRTLLVGEAEVTQHCWHALLA